MREIEGMRLGGVGDPPRDVPGEEEGGAPSLEIPGMAKERRKGGHAYRPGGEPAHPGPWVLLLRLLSEAEGRRRHTVVRKSIMGTPIPSGPNMDREGSRPTLVASQASSVLMALGVHRDLWAEGEVLQAIPLGWTGPLFLV